MAGCWMGHLCIHRDREREAKMQEKTEGWLGLMEMKG